MSASRGGPAGGREEKGSAAGSHRHPPHVTEGVENEPVQESTQAPGNVPVEAANAHGEDKHPAEEAKQPIRSESMYDDRPEEDKDVELDAGG